MSNHNEISSFIWNVCDDVLRGLFKQHEYGDVILPFVVLRRLDCVLEGRDIGTIVFPNADYKFFMTANDRSRAERRLKDLVSVGDKKVSELDAVLDELRVRDLKDSTRLHSPLQRADDAIIIDTTHLAIGEVVNKIVNIVNHKRTLI